MYRTTLVRVVFTMFFFGCANLSGAAEPTLPFGSDDIWKLIGKPSRIDKSGNYIFESPTSIYPSFILAKANGYELKIKNDGVEPEFQLYLSKILGSKYFTEEESKGISKFMEETHKAFRDDPKKEFEKEIGRYKVRCHVGDTTRWRYATIMPKPKPER